MHPPLGFVYQSFVTDHLIGVDFCRLPSWVFSGFRVRFVTAVTGLGWLGLGWLGLGWLRLGWRSDLLLYLFNINNSSSRILVFTIRYSHCNAVGFIGLNRRRLQFNGAFYLRKNGEALWNIPAVGQDVTIFVLTIGGQGKVSFFVNKGCCWQSNGRCIVALFCFIGNNDAISTFQTFGISNRQCEGVLLVGVYLWYN